MGFGSAMKAANNSWGFAVGPSINGVAYIGPKNMINNRSHEMMIAPFPGSGSKEVVFTEADVSSIELLACSSNFIKYKIIFKDGRIFFATLNCVNDQKGLPNMNVANFESWFSHVIYKNTNVSDSSFGEVKQNISKPSLCPNCGEEINDEMDFCGSCGHKLK